MLHVYNAPLYEILNIRRGPEETSIYMHGLTIISIRHREADQARN